jgi:hypothetical protein
MYGYERPVAVHKNLALSQTDQMHPLTPYLRVYVTANVVSNNFVSNKIISNNLVNKLISNNLSVIL